MARSLPLRVPLLLLLAAAPVQAGTRFEDASFDEVLARANKEQRLVMVEVHAAWCKPCQQQKAEVFDTDAGTALTRDALAVRVDFDAEANRAVLARLRVLMLPTVVVLRPDGSEVDRVEGYEQRVAFLAEIRRLLKGKDPLPGLEERLRQAKGAERLTLLVEVGHRRLVRGQEAEGLSLLAEAATMDKDGKAGAAEEALFVHGRYLSRVKDDPARAKEIWRELMLRFPDGRYGSTSTWWYAEALHSLGDSDGALRTLFTRARRTHQRDDVDLIVSFCVAHHRFQEDASAILDELAPHLATEDLRSWRERLAAGQTH